MATRERLLLNESRRRLLLAVLKNYGPDEEEKELHQAVQAELQTPSTADLLTDAPMVALLRRAAGARVAADPNSDTAFELKQIFGSLEQ